MAMQDPRAAVGLRDRRLKSLLRLAVFMACCLPLSAPADAEQDASGPWAISPQFPPASAHHPNWGAERFLSNASLLQDEADTTFDLVHMRQPAPSELSDADVPSPETSGDAGASYDGAEDDSAATGLASVPNMYGDFFSRGSFAFANTFNSMQGTAEYPQWGSLKVGENNSALPQDRFYFLYQHYSQALNFNLSAPYKTPVHRSLSFDRYILGTEKTWNDGIWSFELRAPFSGNANTVFDDGFSANNGNAGNLAVILKCLLYRSETSAVAAGLGMNLPTGSDAQLTIEDCLLTVKNQTLNLQPYLGLLQTWGNRGFFRAFLQLDLPTMGNDVTLQTAAGRFVPQELGKLNERTYLFVDASAGYWLYRAPRATGITGLAGVLEVHYNAGLDDADTLDIYTSKTQFRFGPENSRLNIVNGTVGVHLELFERTVLRVAAAVPVSDRANRSFGNEFSFSVNRSY